MEDLTARLIQFRDARDWGRFHTLKNLMVSLNVEAAELLELAQWKEDGELEARLKEPAFRAAFAGECADVLLYLLLICERAGIDPGQAAADKIAVNGDRYPEDKARGNARKYSEL